MSRFRVRTFAAGAALLAALMPAWAGSITTPGIVATTLSGLASCVRWRPIGTCFWLKCSLSGCTIRTSLKVGHYNPDLVVSAYHRVGENPWVEIRMALGLAQKTSAQTLITGLNPTSVFMPVGEGPRSEDTVSRDHANTLYKEADAIGHPVSALSQFGSPALDAIGVQGPLCPSQTTAFFPYFQSALDVLAWRFAIPEMVYPQSLIPGLREIGHWPLNTWGAVYPRQGFTTQSEEPKAAAVVAQRAGDVVTRTGQPHVYVPVTGSGGTYGGQRVWPPGPLMETNARTGYWQMLTPVPSPACAVFGQNDTLSLAGWSGGKVDRVGDYAWNLWRPYKCCKKRGQWFLGSIDWMSYP